MGRCFLLLREGGEEDVKEQVKRENKEKEGDAKAGSHQVRNVRGVSGANAQHQCFEIASLHTLSRY